MKKAVLAGAVALAMVGPFCISGNGFGVAPAAAQEVNLTEGHIYRLKAALHLRADQLAHWAPVEAALRAVIRSGGTRTEETSNDGLVQKVRTRARGHAVQVSALQNAYASSKRWVRQFTETLRAETNGTGVRVHGMNPGLVITDMLANVTSQRGYEQRLSALQVVVGLWGQSADVAAEPLLRLVTSTAAVYRDLNPPTIVGRGLRNLLAGRVRRSNRMPMKVTVVEPT